MTGEPVVALLGAYGAVGRVVARLLVQALPDAVIRVGGRDVGQARALVDDGLGRAGVAAQVDADDRASLAAFCAGARVVVNCAGPSYRILDRVALAAVAAGADYVDAGGDEPVYESLSARALGARRAVLNAGMMPGLTGLLPRWLAGPGFEPHGRLTGYVGTMDRLTPAGAAEYLLSLGNGHGMSQAAWRHGERAARALTPLTDVELPYFPGRVNAYPFLSTETERTARLLGLDELDWYTVYDGGTHMMNALSRLQGAMTGQSALAPAAAELTRAAALDMFGRDPYQLLVFELTGTVAGAQVARYAAVRGSDTYELTGLVAAMSTIAILTGQVPAGVHFATDVLDPDLVVDELRRLKAVTFVDHGDGPVPARAPDEEGEL